MPPIIDESGCPGMNLLSFKWINGPRLFHSGNEVSTARVIKLG